MRGSFKHPNLGLGCFPLIEKLCLRHLKEVFRRDSSFEHPKDMSVMFVYYRNCYFGCNLWLYKSWCAWCVRLINVNSGQE